MQLVSQSPSSGTPADKTRPRPTRFGKVAAVLSLAALITLSYVCGSAAMYFGLPTSSFLTNAFAEGRRWANREAAPAVVPTGDLAQATVTIDLPDETFDGYTLFTSSQGVEVTLLDMRGRVVHQWNVPFGEQGPGAERVGNKSADSPIHCERCFVYPNGDLLVLYGGPNSPYGESLAKFDKDSRFLWGYSASVHHDFDVGEDGRIYVLTQRAGVKAPSGLDSIPSDYIADYLVVLSPEGKELETVPLLEAFRDSPYLLTFLTDVETDPTFSLPGPMPPHMPPPPPGLPQPPGGGLPPGLAQGPRIGINGRGDILHTNSVKVVSQALAPRYPLFKHGQVLLSLRSPSLVAVLDIPRRTVVWAAKGPWKSQHDARFLDNGHLLLFDNQGSARASRVLEYDPATQAIPWSYTGVGDNKISTIFRGTSQRLPNENTLIVDPDGLRVIEVTKAQHIVWQWGCAHPFGQHNTTKPGTESLSITGATRYSPEELPFLKGKPGTQPR
jgi:hypothetical protein